MPRKTPTVTYCKLCSRNIYIPTLVRYIITQYFFDCNTFFSFLNNFLTNRREKKTGEAIFLRRSAFCAYFFTSVLLAAVLMSETSTMRTT